ncbi:PHP domain protein [Coniochaeta sp. 2T2.1]|nr:PHP domain protein [Coniochaeta sp. 2T2.1]
MGQPIVCTGTVTPGDQLTQKLVAFEVPVGTTSIHVQYSYTGREHGNAIDLGLLGVDKQFRGYSGGSKFDIFVANDTASPGYIAGLLGPGEWYVLLGVYHITSPTVSYTVHITLDDKPRPVFTSTPAPSRAQFSGDLKLQPGRRPKSRWLAGDFHAHTVYSDGKFTLPELAQKALDRGIDFFFSTEHNTFSANLAWGPHVPRNFLVGRGIEVTTKAGHWNAIGLLPEQNISPAIADESDMDASLVAAVEDVHRSDGFAILNHPFAECKCCDWTYSFHDVMDAIEVWNGPWRRHHDDQSNELAVEHWDALLREGRVFTATGGSDVHEHKFEIAEPVTRVLAEDVSVNAVIRGLRARHVYITRHPAYQMDFVLVRGEETAAIGDWLEPEAVTEVVAVVTLRGFPACETILITDKGQVHRSDSAKLNVRVEDAEYVRVEVRTADGDMLGMTNPIWILSSPVTA